jgi:SAM-dependent methyltransferase
MKRFLRNILPASVWRIVQAAAFHATRIYYRIMPRAKTSLESSKARPRRLREGFFEKYCRGCGIDIGYGGDLVMSDCLGWDIEHGDAQTLYGIEDGQFDYVYSSHTLEHVDNAEITLKNWWRAVRPGGFLILYLPHRDLYERKKSLPSRWNASHRRFFLLDRDDPPDTVGVLPLIQKTLSGFEIIEAKLCNDGYKIVGENRQAEGEYSIEVVLKKV